MDYFTWIIICNTKSRLYRGATGQPAFSVIWYNKGTLKPFYLKQSVISIHQQFDQNKQMKSIITKELEENLEEQDPPDLEEEN